MPGTGGFGTPAGFAPVAPSYASQLSAQNLVNPQAMPAWMREAGARPAPAPPAGGVGGAGWGQPNAAFQPQPLQSQPFDAGPRPQPSVPDPGSFAANQLFDASALPEWLRQAGAGQPFDTLATAHQPAPGPGARMAPPAPSAGSAFAPGAFPPVRQGFQPAGAFSPPSAANAFPSIDQAGAFGASQQANVSAQSLLDPNALPSWLGGNGAGATGGFGAQQRAGHIPAQSLLDESSLPQWMRNQPASPPAPAVAAGPMFASPGSQAPVVPGGWGSAQLPVGPLPGPATAATSWGPASATLGTPQLSASGFIDEGALPDWLRAQGQAAGFMPPASAPLANPGPVDDRRVPIYIPAAAAAEQAPSHGSTGATFAASDLIDADSLPQWVRGQSGDGGVSFSSTEGWTSKGPSMPLASGSGSLSGAPSGYTDHQPAPQTAPMDERPNSEESSWFGGDQAANRDGRVSAGPGTGNFRRGAPIPRDQLPSWLRTDAPGGHSGMRPAPAWEEPAALPMEDERERFGPEYRVDAGYEAAPAWDDGGYEQPYDQPYDQQFEGGYDGGYEGGYEGGYSAVDEYGQPIPNDWDEGYGDYDDYDGAQEPRRGFWGRLFGRG